MLKVAVVVVGGGHAGLEAALAAARLGSSVALISLRSGGMGTMPCNPSLGGPAKGHLVRELDALGGEMGRAGDETLLQMKVLNRSKGPAVQALRAQIDKEAYAARMQATIAQQAQLEVVEDEAIAFEREGGGWTVHLRGGGRLCCAALVLTTGTFLQAICHTGEAQHPGGRREEAGAMHLSRSLLALGLPLRRLKTGTPPRLATASIQHQGLERDEGDRWAPSFSWVPTGKRLLAPEAWLPCWKTETTEATHAILRANLTRSPMRTGAIQGAGPRYCPSVEDKVERFAAAASHPIFLEPETLRQDWTYVQGFSTSLPEEVQLAALRTIPGLEEAEVMRFGYAVEYDALRATALAPTLQALGHEGLFTAGQLNGTSGYEEAAAQGLVAGVNAARHAQGLALVQLPRSSSYLGTLIDDLSTKELDDPYRMLTSRSEHRLALRMGNSDQRLTPVGREWGLVDDERWEAFCAKQAALEAGRRWMKGTRVREGSPLAQAIVAASGVPVVGGPSVEEALRRPQVGWALVAQEGQGPSVPAEVGQELEVEAKYAGYLARQDQAVAKAEKQEAVPIPEDLDFGQVEGLSHEAKERWRLARPTTLGQAGRVGGVRPSDVALLEVALRRRREA